MSRSYRAHLEASAMLAAWGEPWTDAAEFEAYLKRRTSMSKAKPTNPPWEQDGLRGGLVNVFKGVCHIAVVGDHRDDGAEALENAKLIVRAVNNHAALVAACEEMLNEFRRDYGNGIANGYWPEVAEKVERWSAALEAAKGTGD